MTMVMTIEEMSQYLKIFFPTRCKLAHEGKVPGQKIGRHWRFHRAVTDQWLGHRTGNLQTTERT
ncbi:MAG: excisionase family DNA-binding protein [Phycisphaeraceae bacterium]|nr:excisionase family DNA-binding protein [Phycisphaeraceae bacterium]